ncbi:Acetyl esterase/lipase [Thermomonospora echinospora]|uniref:Acetyl esterase/lipase n=1 Tax=Thermomonospora echinospora TaxID=1992 RepID=A0A1H6ABF5_9ACTN|nr:alpha/beta hydrolase [Thermomonospora echinospora]SEG46089.1 Acetyl esterase/lipase [Thermomonospora echinospora]
MRKVLVFGTALAAASLSTVAVPAEAHTEPGPAVNAPVTPGRGTVQTNPGGGVGVTARAVMVTPLPPKTATYSYGKGARQKLDAYWRDSGPDDAAPRPAVLILHGGYWMSGDKGSWRYMARRLVTRGYVVFSANYRLIPSSRWPSQREDVEAALDYIRSHAHRWNLDPSRIVVLGSSAGGHLATQLGTYGEGARRVRGVVALSPVVSPSQAYQDGGLAGADYPRVKLRHAVQMLVGCSPDEGAPECLDRLEDASSAAHAGAGDAPMLLVHSAEEFVPVSHSEGLAEALRAAGVPVTVRTVPGDAHGGTLLNDERLRESVIAWIDSVAKG